MRNSLAFVADVVSIFRKQVVQFIDPALVKNLTEVLANFSNNQENQAILEYAKKVLINSTLSF